MQHLRNAVNNFAHSCNLWGVVN